jgi:glycosidase
MLDFVPNHMGLDHPWVEEHPEYFIAGTEFDLARAPQNYTWVKRKRGDLLLAYGRDPYFAGWPDTLQLNYGNPATQVAMIGELRRIAGQCDGVRCDMAMLVLPDVFERTWGIRAEPFWPTAIAAVRQKHPNFLFMAEVYWDLEWTMQRQGFNYPTTSGCTTACARAMRGRRASTSGPGWTFRTSWPASWKTTTSPGRQPPSPRGSTRRRPS